MSVPLASERARAVAEYLTSVGWPAPIQAMSGNGYHLLYGIDLPADDGGLVRAVLAALADGFSDERVAVDRSVHNAARIVKIVGTMSRKGDNLRGVAGLEDRPHRRAEFVAAPDEIDAVPEERLRAVADAHGGPCDAPRANVAAPVANVGDDNGRFNCTPAGVRAWLEAHGVALKGEPTRAGNKDWLFKRVAWRIQALAEGDLSELDYGTEPDQKAAYFTLRDIRRTLADASLRAGLEGVIYAGLERLTDATLGREWRRDDGAMVRIDRCLIDANWGQSSDVVYQFCRQRKHAGVVMPAHGRYVGASSIPFADYKRKRGDRVGLNWRIPLVGSRRPVRHALFDTNYWKSFVHARLAVPMGDPGCLSLFGRKPEQHRLLAEHLTSEYRVKTEGRGRTVDEWTLRVGGLDNHWLDCLVGCAVAASMEGAAPPGLVGDTPKARPAVRLSELRRSRR